MSASAATNDALLPASRSTYILQFPWSLVVRAASLPKEATPNITNIYTHACMDFLLLCCCFFLALFFMFLVNASFWPCPSCLPVCMHMSCAVKTNMRPLNWHVSRVGENTTIPCHPGSAYLYTTFLSCGHSFVQVLSSSCWFKYPLSRKWKLHTHRQNKNSSKALFSDSITICSV